MVVALGPGKFYGSSLPRPRIYTDVKNNDHRVDPPAPVLDPLISWAQEAHWSMGGLSFKRLRLQGRIEGNVKKLRAQREKLDKKRKRNSAASAADQIESDGDSEEEEEYKSSPSPPPAPIVTKRRRFLDLIDEEDDDEGLKQTVSKESGGDGEIGARKRRRRLVRKLGDDFNRVASESGLGKSSESPVKNQSDGSETVALRTRSRRSEETNDVTDAVKVVGDLVKSNSKGKGLESVAKAKRVSDKGASSPAAAAGGGGCRTSPRLAKQRST